MLFLTVDDLPALHQMKCVVSCCVPAAGGVSVTSVGVLESGGLLQDITSDASYLCFGFDGCVRPASEARSRAACGPIRTLPRCNEGQEFGRRWRPARNPRRTTANRRLKEDAKTTSWSFSCGGRWAWVWPPRIVLYNEGALRWKPPGFQERAS